MTPRQRSWSRRLSVAGLSTLLVIPTVVLSTSTTPAVASTLKPAASIVTSRPDPVSAVQTARAEHRRILITSDDTVFTSTYANPNGSFTLASSLFAVRALNDKGAWVKVSSQLADVKSHLVVRGANPLNPSFASTTASGPLVSVDPSGLPFSMTPLGVTASPLLSHPLVVSDTQSSRPLATGITASSARLGSNLAAVTALEGRVTSRRGDEVVFAHALGATALVETLGTSSVSQDLVVPSAAAAAGGDWRFMIDAVGYHPRVTSEGIEFLARGEEPLLIPSAFAADSARDPATHRVSLRLSKGVGPGTWVLDASLPLTWLHAASRVWPVSVDPTVNLGMNTGINYRSDGATQAVVNGTGVNQGGFEGDQTVASGSNPAIIWRSGIAFSVGSLTSSDHIDSASITLAVHTGGATACRDGSVYLASAASYAGMKTGTALSSTSGSPLCAGGSSGTLPTSSTLVSAVQSLVNGSAVILGFTGNEATSTSTWKQFLPTLSVTYDTVPTVPTIVGTAPISCSNAKPATPTAYVNTTTPLLCAYSNDPDSGANLKYQVYVATSSGSVFYSYETAAIPAGTDVAYQVPSTAGLADGGSYEWQMDAYNGISYSPVSAWVPFVVDTTPPTDVGIACSSTSPEITTTGENLDPSAMPSGGLTLTCTFSAYDLNMKQYSYQLNGAGGGAIGVSGSLSNEYATTVTVPISSSATGLQAISVFGTDKAGNSSTSALWTLNIGIGMSQPFLNADAVTTVPISAVLPSSASTYSNTSAKVCWAVASSLVAPGNTCQSGVWTNVTSHVTNLATGATWTGNVENSPNGTGTMTPTPSAGPGTGYINPYNAPSLSLNLAAAHILGPNSIDVEVCFVVNSGTAQCANPVAVSVLAHGQGNAMATASVGPGTLALSSGEFSTSGPSVSLQGEGPTSDITLSTTYSSMPSPSDDNSEFGPGWTTSAPPGGGVGNYTVTDTSSGGTAVGAVILSSPTGTQYQFNVTNPVLVNQSTTPTMTSVGDAYQAGLIATMANPTQVDEGSVEVCTVDLDVFSSDGWETQFVGYEWNGSDQSGCGTGQFNLGSVKDLGGSRLGSWNYNPATYTGEPVIQPLDVVAKSPNSCAASYSVPTTY